MAVTTKTKNKMPGDLIRHEIDPLHSRKAYVLRNTSGGAAAIANPVGLPCKVSGGKMVPVLATDEANATALLLTSEDIASVANNTDYASDGSNPTKHSFLVWGAKVDKAMIATTDPAGGTYTLADLVTALGASGIRIDAEAEPAVTETQSE